MGYAEALQRSLNKTNKNILFGKPTDCKHCYAASMGVMGVHYSCDCEESKMYRDHPLIMCPQDCKFYEKEVSDHD